MRVRAGVNSQANIAFGSFSLLNSHPFSAHPFSKQTNINTFMVCTHSGVIPVFYLARMNSSSIFRRKYCFVAHMALYHLDIHTNAN